MQTKAGRSVVYKGEPLHADEVRLMLSKMRHAQASKAVSDKARRGSAIELPETIMLQAGVLHFQKRLFGMYSKGFKYTKPVAHCMHGPLRD